MWVFNIFPFLQNLEIGEELIFDVKSEYPQQKFITFVFLANPVFTRAYCFEERVFLADLLLLFGLSLTHAMLYKKYR